MLDTIINGTRHLLDFCRQLKMQPKILLTSSGAVYGEQPLDVKHLSESMSIAPNLYGVRGAYSLGKCMSEHLCYQYPSDLVIWLWTILVSGQSVNPYNVGSAEDYTLQEVAQFVAEIAEPHLSLTLSSLTDPIEISRYVPSIELEKTSLGLYNRVNFKEALLRTLLCQT